MRICFNGRLRLDLKDLRKGMRINMRMWKSRKMMEEQAGNEG